MEWTVYDKTGTTERCKVHKLEYSGTWMGECFVTADITSACPIAFEIGDYLEYRGDRFEINYDPSVLKKAKKNSIGDAFTYTGVKFNSLSDELARCDFLDFVKEDNNIHYTSLPNFSFYAASIQDLADRIQVNLDRIYTGEKKWTVVVHPEYVDTTDVNIEANNIKVWDALGLAYSKFKATFIVRGRTITIGTAGIAVGNLFKYGKGNGLKEIERQAESNQQIITRLRAYGSTKNLPSRYYATVGKKYYATVTNVVTANEEEGSLGISVNLGADYKEGMFTNMLPDSSDVLHNFRITFELNGVTLPGRIQCYPPGSSQSHDLGFISTGSEYVGGTEQEKLSELIRQIKEDTPERVYIVYGLRLDMMPGSHIYSPEFIPNNMAVDHLMLPGFPDETTDPYIDSENMEVLGIREASVFFDGSNEDLPEIFPTLEGMTADELRAAGVSISLDEGDNGNLDEVVTAESVTDDGVPDTGGEIEKEKFTVMLKDIGFPLDDYLTDETSVSMKDGMCGGREFEVTGAEKQGNKWVVTCSRVHDESIGLFFPNDVYKISAGDKFVLLGIEMPDVYVKAASQKLLEEAKAYLAENDYVRYAYFPTVDDIYLARQHDEAAALGEASIHDTIKEGDLMLFEDEDLGIDGSIIIDKLTIKEGDGIIPQYSITLRDEKTTGSLEKIQNQIDSIVNGGMQGGGGLTTQQVKSIVKAVGDSLFLSKLKEDTAQEVITFLKGLRIAGHYISKVILSPEELDEADDAIMSVLKAVNTFLRKDKEDTTNFLLKLVGGAEFGKYEAGKSGGKVDVNGAAEFLSLLVRGLVTASGIESADFSTGALGTGFTLKIDENGDSYIEVDRMLVRKVATFVELLIQKIRAVGGQIILSPATMNCSRVEEHDTFYRCYFENTDGEKTIAQEFVVGDQARCQTFNVKEGVNENVTNTYYWRLVVAVGDDYIDLSKTDCDAGSTVPQAGDDIVQLGNRTDATRQAAIVLAAYGNDAPYFKMYRGIDSYSLSGKEFISFSRTEVMIIADSLRFSTGESVKDYIDNATGNAITGVDVEYALGDSPTEAPQTGWSTTAPEWQVGKYMWQRTKTTTSKGSSYSEPTCIQGAKGDKGDQGLQGLQGEKGEQGIPGTPGKDGADGKTLYTWIRYADDAQGNGMSNDPTGKAFIGFAYNKDTATESDNPADYAWSDIKGEQGVKGDKGEDGTQYYTWIKYSDNADGSGMYDTPKSTTQYIGIAVNKTSPTESNTPTDYTWSKFKGDKGDQGPQGIPGADGADGRTSYFHIKYSSKANPTSAADMTETPSEYIGTYVDYTAADSTDPSDYTWSRFQGIQGEKGDQGIPGTSGADGKTYYLHIAYANSADGSQGFSTTDSANKLYIGQYTDTTQADSTDYKKYSWTKIKGDTGKGVSALEEQYYLSTSNTTQTGGSWQTTCPAWESGKYIWTRTKVTWTDNTVTYTTPVLAEDINDLGAKLEQAISDLAENIDFVNSLSEELETVKDQVDGAIETWFYAPVPTLTNAPASSWTTTELKNQHLGDLYYDGNGKAYRFQMSGSNYVWQVITDTDITKALANAQKAQDTADGKRRVFVTTPTNASAYDVGDLWVNATYGSYSNDLLRCKTAKAAGAAWNISHWEKASKYTDDTKANQAIADAAEALAAANDAQDTANAAKERLDGWAADNVISPTEKQALKDEMARIDGDKSEITENYTKYGLGTPTAYNNAHSAYRAVLVTLSAATPETIAIPSDFATKQTAYYTARTDALTAIADAAKAYVDSIEIGARNYILNTGKAYSFTGKNVSNQVAFGGWVLKKEAATIGDYIFTVKLKFENCTFVDESVCWFQTNNNNGWGYTMLGQTRKTVKENGEYTFQGRYTWNKADVTGNTQIDFRVDYVGGGTVTVSEMRLYKGTKDVGWTPAPEDAENSLNDYKEEVEAKFEATNESITAAVESVKSYTDEKGEHILSETTSMINVAKNDISLSVDTKINNLQIGGRNLLRYSGLGEGILIGDVTTARGNHSRSIDTTNTYNGHNSVKVTATGAGSNTGVNDFYWFSWLRNTTLNDIMPLVYTFYAKAGKNATKMGVRCGNNTTKLGEVTLTTSWTKYELKFTPVAKWSDIVMWLQQADTVWIALPKLEKGTKATDWTPAPEDTEASITELSARIEVTEDSIKNTVSKTEFDALGNTVSSHTSQITQLNNQISSKVSSSELTEKLKGYVTTTTYNNKMSSIDQSLSSITSRVTNTETSINTIDGSLQSITERVSTAEQKITDEAINMTVKEQTTQIANEAAADTVVGGGNLLKYSSLPDSITISDIGSHTGSEQLGNHTYSIDKANKYAGHNTLKIVATGAGDNMNNRVFWQTWKNSDEGTRLNPKAGPYILSFYAKAGKAGTKLNYRCGNNTTKLGEVTLTTSWTKYEVKPVPLNDWGGMAFWLSQADTVWMALPKVWNTSLSEYSTTSEIKSSFTMTANGISLLGQNISLTGKVTFSMLASDAQGKVNTAQQAADNAQTAANTANTGLTSLKNSLGDLAYQNKVEKAMLGTTVISGAYIKTDLIDVDNLYVRHLEGADGVFTGSLQAATGSFSGRIDANSGTIGGAAIGDYSLTYQNGVYLTKIGANALIASGSIGTNLYIQITGTDSKEAVIIDAAPYSGAMSGIAENREYAKALTIRRGTLRVDPGNLVDMPGVLLAGRVNGSGDVLFSLGKKRVYSSYWRQFTCTYPYGGYNQYRIVHNIGHTNYGVIAMPFTPNASWRKQHAHLLSMDANTFCIGFIDSGTESSLQQCNFSFVVIGENE